MTDPTRKAHRTTFGCGGQTWPNIDVLIADAAGARDARVVAGHYRKALIAVALDHPNLRVSETSLQAASNYDLSTLEDRLTRDVILCAVRRER